MDEPAPRGLLRVRDRIPFDGSTQQIVGLEGMALRLDPEPMPCCAVVLMLSPPGLR